MSAIEAGLDWVPGFPLLEVHVLDTVTPEDRFAPTLQPQHRGRQIMHGTSRDVTAPDDRTLRAGLIAEAAQSARRHGRPVRVRAIDPAGVALLAVHPEGYTEPIDESGTLAPVDLPVLRGDDARCRSCRAETYVGGSFCSRCGCPMPHQLTTTAHVDLPAAGGVDIFTAPTFDAAVRWVPRLAAAAPEPTTIELPPMPAPQVGPARRLTVATDAPRLPVSPTAADGRLWVLGVHGGAGESTLAGLLPGAVDGAHAWPAPGPAPARVLLCTRTNSRGLDALQAAVIEWAAGLVPGVDLVGAVTIADAPGRLPRPLLDRSRHVTAGAPRTWHLDWVAAWRLTPPAPGGDLPKPVAGLLEDLERLRHQR